VLAQGCVAARAGHKERRVVWLDLDSEVEHTHGLVNNAPHGHLEQRRRETASGFVSSVYERGALLLLLLVRVRIAATLVFVNGITRNSNKPSSASTADIVERRSDRALVVEWWCRTIWQRGCNFERVCECLGSLTNRTIAHRRVTPKHCEVEIHRLRESNVVAASSAACVITFCVLSPRRIHLVGNALGECVCCHGYRHDRTLVLTSKPVCAKQNKEGRRRDAKGTSA
jgi:hypothetical protein